MMEKISQYVAVGAAVLAAVVLCYFVARMILKLIFIAIVLCLIVFSLSYFGVLPEPLEQCIQKLSSCQIIQDVKGWYSASEAEK